MIYLIYFFLTFNPVHHSITQQKPELLLHESDTFFLYVEFREHSPLAPLFSLEAFGHQLESQIDTTCWSSACARAFAPVWKIHKNKLYLYELRHCCSEQSIDLDLIFKPKHINRHGVKAFWVNETISVSDDFASIYFFDPEAYFKIKWFDITIQKGKVKSWMENE